MVRSANRMANPAGASFVVAHEGAVYRVAVKRVGSARRFTLRVKAATAEAVLTIPARASLRSAQGFAERHADWIGARLRALPGPIPIRDGGVIPVRGVDHRIVLAAAAQESRGRRAAELRSNGGVGECEIRVSGDHHAAGAAVGVLLKREAMLDLRAAVLRHAATVERDVARVVVRDTRSRWGSCSGRGTLSFSWRLIMAPPFVLDYLAAHEVAHLRHMDHSAAFWTLVGRLSPRVADAEAWLKTKGQHLHRFAIGA